VFSNRSNFVPLTRIPLDLEIKPYRDEQDTAVLTAMQKTRKRELAGRRRKVMSKR